MWIDSLFSFLKHLDERSDKKLSLRTFTDVTLVPLSLHSDESFVKNLVGSLP